MVLVFGQYFKLGRKELKRCTEKSKGEDGNDYQDYDRKRGSNFL
jgi:hypothetical protein